MWLISILNMAQSNMLTPQKINDAENVVSPETEEMFDDSNQQSANNIAQITSPYIEKNIENETIEGISNKITRIESNQEVIFNMLESIQTSQSQIFEIITTLMTQHSEIIKLSTCENHSPPEMVSENLNFNPISTIDELVEFDKKLSQDSYMNNVVSKHMYFRV